MLSGTVPLNSSLVRDGATNLQFLGVSETPRDGRDLLAPNLIRILLAELREQFDYIVIDTAPVLGVADARSVAREADRQSSSRGGAAHQFGPQMPRLTCFWVRKKNRRAGAYAGRREQVRQQ